jgi:hypothetical protein
MVEVQHYICGCVVKAHSKCLELWFSKPDSKCIYCRKKTKVLNLSKPQRPYSVSPLIIGRLPPRVTPTPRRLDIHLIPSPPPPRRLDIHLIPSPPPPRLSRQSTTEGIRRTHILPSRNIPHATGERKTNSPKYTTTQIVVILFVQILMITIITLCVVFI